MPPAVQHAHAFGDQPHDHNAAHAENCSANHEHPHSHGTEEKNSPATMPTCHFHLTFLGVDFHLPVGGSSDAPKDGPKLPDLQTQTVVRICDGEGLLKNSVTCGMFAGLLPPGFWSIMTIPKPQPRIEGETLARLLVCDSARGERSGVQLI